jgi:NADH-quinone oxidoreductase subunit F
MTLLASYAIWNFARFYHHESCGQCSHVVKVQDGWKKYYTESKTVTDVKKTLICYGVSKVKLKETRPLGDAASWPVAAAIRHFREEFEYHVRFRKIKNRNHFFAEPSKSKAFSF